MGAFTMLQAVNECLQRASNTLVSELDSSGSAGRSPHARAQYAVEVMATKVYLEGVDEVTIARFQKFTPTGGGNTVTLPPNIVRIAPVGPSRKRELTTTAGNVVFDLDNQTTNLGTADIFLDCWLSVASFADAPTEVQRIIIERAVEFFQQINRASPEQDAWSKEQALRAEASVTANKTIRDPSPNPFPSIAAAQAAGSAAR